MPAPAVWLVCCDTVGTPAQTVKPTTDKAESCFGGISYRCFELERSARSYPSCTRRCLVHSGAAFSLNVRVSDISFFTCNSEMVSKQIIL